MDCASSFRSIWFPGHEKTLMDPLPEFAAPTRKLSLTEDFSTLTSTSPYNCFPKYVSPQKVQTNFFNSKIDVQAAFRRSSAARNQQLKDAVVANVLVPQRPANAEFTPPQVKEITLTNFDLEKFLRSPKFKVAGPELEALIANRKSLSRLPRRASHINGPCSDSNSEYSEFSCRHDVAKSILKHDDARRLPPRCPKLAMDGRAPRCQSCCSPQRVCRLAGIGKDSPHGYPDYVPPLLQPYEACGAYNPLTPVASRSLLTCNREFQQQFPNVYAGLCKGLLDITRLMVHEVVIPVKETVTVHKSTVRTRRALVGAVSGQFWRSFYGKFPDPDAAPMLVKNISEHLFKEIERSVQQAEGERSFLQWLLRFDVDTYLDVRVTPSLVFGRNAIIANVEGSASIKRCKGGCFSMLNPDFLCIEMDSVVKALFLNGGQLLEINNDPRFISYVRQGPSKLAAAYLNSF